MHPGTVSLNSNQPAGHAGFVKLFDIVAGWFQGFALMSFSPILTALQDAAS